MIFGQFKELERLKKIEILRSVDLARFTTIKLSIIGDLIKVFSEAALAQLLKAFHSNNLNYHIIGWGANQVISRSDGVIFMTLNFPLDRNVFKQVRDEYHLPASTPLNVLQAHAQKFGLKGWEVMTGIPASLGGAIYMNAGTSLGEIKEIVKDVTIMSKSGERRTVSIGPKSFSYRMNHFTNSGDVIISATLIHHGQSSQISQQIKEYMNMRKQTQPLRSKNCGCVWKNVSEFHKAGLYIDKLGLGGLEVGGLVVSELHSNFYENRGGATYEDFERLTKIISDHLELHTGIEFELEAKVY